jgi:3',5'-nucleoside bisphosphate phosphatase
VIDLHLHTDASDGRLTPPALVHLAREAGLSIISITDHDTTAGLVEARPTAEALGVRLVSGIEITAVEDQRDVHVLGYFFDADSPVLRRFLEAQREDRVRRVRIMADRLNDLGLAVDLGGALAAAPPGRAIGRPQLADALVAAGHAVSRRDAFDRWLGSGRPAFVPRCGAPVAEIVAVLASAGGIASLAHPALSGVDDRIPAFAAAGLASLEAKHADQDDAAESRYRALAADLGLAVSGGSDFHGDDAHHAPMLGRVTLGHDDFAALEARAGRLRAVPPAGPHG